MVQVRRRSLVLKPSGLQVDVGAFFSRSGWSKCRFSAWVKWPMRCRRHLHSCLGRRKQCGQPEAALG
jgi:hypothetical protein